MPDKKTNVEIIQRTHDNGEVREPYVVMEKLIGQHHPHLASAKIALAWRYGWKPDTDGRITLGQAKKVDEANRDLHGYDFIILLNYEAYVAADFTAQQREALIDHELCHCQVSVDKESGEEKQDEKGRPVWRMRGHDIEEFQEIVARHGCWKWELEKFAQKALEKKNAHSPLFQETN